jgi:Do/DeqQ family serine protease
MSSKIRTATLVAGMVAATAAVSVGAQALTPGAEEAAKTLFNPTVISDVAEKVSPAVVRIATKTKLEQTMGRRSMRRYQFGPGQPDNPGFGMGVASGVIISNDGYIVTNNHVVEQAGDVRVTLDDGRELEAKVIGTDPPADLALLKVDAKNLPFLKFGDSSKLRLGEIVLAIGNPFGVGQTVTMGIVSAKGRSGMGIVDYEDFIQTDAAINPGNSGGALVGLDGSLVGINTAIVSRSGGAAGIGFAVPASMVSPLIEQMRQGGKVHRGWLGVAIQDLTPELSKMLKLGETRGVVISDVLSEGPAAKGGMESGDVVLSIDDREISSASELRNRVAMIAPGKKIKVVVNREGTKKELSIRVDEKPAPAQREIE